MQLLNKCSSQERISKTTLLAMLEDQTETDDFYEQSQFLIDQRERGLAYAESRYERYRGLKTRQKGPRNWLVNLPDDSWDIISFDSHSRTVCIEMRNNSTTSRLSLVLPDPSNTGD